ncbi:hypothetical protein LTR05_001345 [Lithohypha guttulata]|uniref:Oxysterol-binding protein n=1 Tax=Lithohypha guttulata TaxID=1690604 RepID=A0AAN7T7N3_9EURO|nr:hypothetical protein LTR05_001345 [Lithohypha guttulata]
MVFSSLRYLANPTFSAAQDGTPDENPMASNKSSLKDFLASIASMTGDLSNITAPPFVLDQKSVVEIPAFWAENPDIFVSPSTSEEPAERALLVLKSFLAGMKSQCYLGHSQAEGVKKPLNAFLGELFIGHWEDEKIGNTYLVSEQVSHHPPITACRVWNPTCGVVAEGYNRQKVTFSWSSMQVHVTSTGFALKSIEKYGEHYLIPLPDFKVKGVLSGAPYPEVEGTYYIPSTNGYMSKIEFAGQTFLGRGKRHGFSAALYKEEEGPKHPIYTIEGSWGTEFTIRDVHAGKDIETFNISEVVSNLPELKLPNIEDMDPWESRRAWHDTQEGIRNNDFKAVNAAKSYLEEGQRSMRKEEEKSGTTWQPLFFNHGDSHEIVASLMDKVPGEDFAAMSQETDGTWFLDTSKYEKTEKPYHPGLEPDNLKEGEERIYRNGSRSSMSLSRSSTPRGSVDLSNGAAVSPSRSSSRRSSVDVRNGVNRDGRRTSLEHTQRRNIEDKGNGHDKRRDSTHGDYPRASLEYKQRRNVDEKVGAVDNARRLSVDSRTNVGRHPESQSTPLRNVQELGQDVEGISLNDKTAVEDMLRDVYSSGGHSRRGSKKQT